MRAFVKSSISLLIFYLVVLSVTESGVMKSIIVELTIYPLKSVNFCFMYFEDLLLAVYTFTIAVSS